MAQIPNKYLIKGRRRAARALTVRYTKAEANAVFQGLEDWFVGELSTINGVINAATSPTVLSSEEKTALVAVFLELKAGIELGKLRG